MKIYQIINSYYLIINKIKGSDYPSFEEIQEHLAENGISISLRTLQRDLQNIRHEFSIEVIYNKSQNGYILNTETSSNFKYFM
ncbi:MAG: hypothetical protein C0596_08990 [Marinilabiliales bacterium]|nr:MAG: hypothetical protein C0596_08990 [Marinilabiliales bacterium]